MENCLLHGKEICAYDLKDGSGFYDNELVVAWKELAHNKQLVCLECGNKVRLAAGQIMEPYFAHYDKKECTYGNLVESEESRKAKRLLYSLAKHSFPEFEVSARYKLTNGLYATIYIKNQAGADIAIEFRRQNLTVEQFRIREQFYQQQGIKVIYVLAIELDRDGKQLSWYQDLVHKSMDYAVFINVFKETLLFKKSFEYVLDGKRKIKLLSMEYPIKELSLDIQGKFICDFERQCDDTKRKLDELIASEERRIKEAREREAKRYQRFRDEMLLKEKEARRYQRYQEEILLKEKDERLDHMHSKVDELVNKKILPDWARDDILKTAITYMHSGEGHLVSSKYRALVEELGLLQE